MTNEKEKMAGDQDRIEGKVNEVVGAARKAIGHLAGDEKMEAEGTVQELKGKVQGVIGEAKKKLAK